MLTLFGGGPGRGVPDPAGGVPGGSPRGSQNWGVFDPILGGLAQVSGGVPGGVCREPDPKCDIFDRSNSLA